MAEAVVSSTLEIINKLVIEETELLWGVHIQVEEIQRELRHLECLLEDADSKQHEDKIVRNWVREVKDVCYEIEDVLEEYAVEVASKRSGEGIKKIVKRIACLPSEAIALHKVGTHITRILSRITNLRNRSQDHGILSKGGQSSTSEANETQWWLRQTYAHEADKDFVGMHTEIAELISMMVDDDKDHQVVSIYGMGGLGKTTLARKIYSHPKVKHCYEAFAWCCITQQCNLKVVLQDILKQLLIHGVMNMNQIELVRELHKVLGEKKCLIVVDDIWEENHWKILSKAFASADQESKSKILLTTRIRQVAEIGHTYKLRSLTEEEGWELFCKKAFPRSEETDMKIDPKYKDVGKKIVGKCGGLPLAISVLGGLLKSRSSLSEWQEVIDSHLSEELSGSIEKVLALSYNDLPYQLKPCFLYMGILQEDEEIEVRTLYHLWIAEGMVSGKKESMMDVAEAILNELAFRSMVQVQMNKGSRRIESCKLHDLMRDLCLNKGKEEGFLESFDLDANRDISSFSNTNTRRLAVFSSNFLEWEPLSSEQISKQSLRTLYLNTIELHGRLNFRSCRALSLNHCGYDESKLSKDISKMVHLRYLSLSELRFEKLLPSVGDLQYLETLDLRNARVYIPNNIFSKMKRLRHLYLEYFSCGKSKKLRLNGLMNLETLEGFNSEKCWNKDLSKLVNLRYFGARLGKDELSLIIDQINSWNKIKWVKIEMMFSIQQHLSQENLGKMLTCRNLCDLTLRGIHVGTLPKYGFEVQLWPNLMRLFLEETELDEEWMEFLKKLPNLRELILFPDAFNGKEIICDAMDFPQLVSLELWDLDNLEKWRVDEGAFPNLSSLEIDNCKKLEIIPEDGFRYLITNLKEFQIDGMPEEFMRKYVMLSGQQREEY